MVLAYWCFGEELPEPDDIDRIKYLCCIHPNGHERAIPVLQRALKECRESIIQYYEKKQNAKQRMNAHLVKNREKSLRVRREKRLKAGLPVKDIGASLNSPAPGGVTDPEAFRRKPAGTVDRHAIARAKQSMPGALTESGVRKLENPALTDKAD